VVIALKNVANYSFFATSASYKDIYLQATFENKSKRFFPLRFDAIKLSQDKESDTENYAILEDKLYKFRGCTPSLLGYKSAEKYSIGPDGDFIAVLVEIQGKNQVKVFERKEGSYNLLATYAFDKNVVDCKFDHYNNLLVIEFADKLRLLDYTEKCRTSIPFEFMTYVQEGETKLFRIFNVSPGQFICKKAFNDFPKKIIKFKNSLHKKYFGVMFDDHSLLFASSQKSILYLKNIKEFYFDLISENIVYVHFNDSSFKSFSLPDRKSTIEEKNVKKVEYILKDNKAYLRLHYSLHGPICELNVKEIDKDGEVVKKVETEELYVFTGLKGGLTSYFLNNPCFKFFQVNPRRISTLKKDQDLDGYDESDSENSVLKKRKRDRKDQNHNQDNQVNEFRLQKRQKRN